MLSETVNIQFGFTYVIPLCCRFSLKAVIEHQKMLFMTERTALTLLAPLLACFFSLGDVAYSSLRRGSGFTRRSLYLSLFSS